MIKINCCGNGNHSNCALVERPSHPKPEAMAKITNKKQNKDEMRNAAEVMRAMAHSDRLAILKLLCTNKTEGLTVKRIYERLRLQQPVVSRHLNILKSAGVVRRKQEGQKISYCLCMDKKNIELVLKCLC